MNPFDSVRNVVQKKSQEQITEVTNPSPFGLVHVSENAFYEHWTTSWGMRSLAKRLQADIRVYDLHDFQTLSIDRDSRSDLIVVLHAAFPKIYRVSIKQLRTFFPHAKIVTLGSDCCAYLAGHRDTPGTSTVKADYEFDSPEDVDLHLDTLTEVIEEFERRGITCDRWMWTCSEPMLDYLEAFVGDKVNFHRKVFHSISLCNVRTDYRSEMRNHIMRNGGNTLIGIDEGNMDKVWWYFSRSWLNIGSTSPSWTPQRTMKGCRDWASPALNTLLIYDDHPDVVKGYADHHEPFTLKTGQTAILNHLPMYHYGDFDGIMSLVKHFQNPENYQQYQDLVTAQRAYARKLTIENQFIHVFKKHGFI